jgi:hypothetical protein
MTALTRYARLESPGLWRASPEAQRQNVHVTFGKATLVITDPSGRVVTHWSLPAVERLNPGVQPALYGPDGDPEETLEVAEPDMIEAIETVRRTLARSRPRQGRLRVVGLLTSVAAVLALGVFWLPGAMIQQTLTAVPAVKRSEIGAALLGHIQRLTGPACRERAGQRALAAFGDRLIGDGAAGGIVVLPTGAVTSLYLPGGIIVLGRPVVEAHDDPAVTAGFILAAAAQTSVRDPLEAVLRSAGPVATFRLFTTGDLPPEVLSTHAMTLLNDPPPPVPAQTMIPFFEGAGVPTTPYAYARDPSGETVLELIEATPAGADRPVLLPDGEWVTLQAICSA